MDSYLPPFEACVERGRATGVMCSYNAVNGEKDASFYGGNTRVRVSQVFHPVLMTGSWQLFCAVAGSLYVDRVNGQEMF